MRPVVAPDIHRVRAIVFPRRDVQEQAGDVMEAALVPSEHDRSQEGVAYAGCRGFRGQLQADFRSPVRVPREAPARFDVGAEELQPRPHESEARRSTMVVGVKIHPSGERKVALGRFSKVTFRLLTPAATRGPGVNSYLRR